MRLANMLIFYIKNILKLQKFIIQQVKQFEIYIYDFFFVRKLIFSSIQILCCPVNLAFPSTQTFLCP